LFAGLRAVIDHRPRPDVALQDLTPSAEEDLIIGAETG